MKALPLFRNDDVSFDTEMDYFPQFCKIFWKYGYIQTHAVALHGLCNYAYRYQGEPTVYPGYPTLSSIDNETIRRLSAPYKVADNKRLIDFLNSCPDRIALHGLYHTNYAAMSADEQKREMAEGLAQLQRLFPQKKIAYFVPPFNKYNQDTINVANVLDLRILGIDGAHLEEDIAFHKLNLYPGIWYRYHHHRFYPTSQFDIAELNLSLLDQSLAKASGNACRGRLPMPSFDYEGDMKELKRLVAAHKAQSWYVVSAEQRRDRHEFARAMGWIYSRLEYDASIFEVGCGSGNNLLWLAQHGYEKLGGSDVDPKALAVARGMAEHAGHTWDLREGSLFEPEHLPTGIDAVLALNCVYYHDEFDLEDFLRRVKPRLSENGHIIMDQIDVSFNSRPCNAIHTTEWHLANAAKPSEYKKRVSFGEVKAIAQKVGLKLMAAMPCLQCIPRIVYVFAMPGADGAARRDLPGAILSATAASPVIDAIFVSGEFDYAWYRKQYVCGPEVMDPLEHYVRFGAAKGYWPNPHFNTDLYRSKHMLLGDPANPLVHYLLHGKKGADNEFIEA